MANILYYTRENFIKKGRAGGMKTKSDAIQESWSSDGLHTVEASASLEDVLAYDVVIVELLALNDFEVLEDRLQVLEDCQTVLIYGSDSELLRWKGKDIHLLREKTFIKWIANCQWQANYFQNFDLPVIGIVREPVNCDLFRPNVRPKPRILAGGNVSYEKNTTFFIELFQKLREMDTGDYETMYVGDANLWGDFSVLGLKLANALEAVTHKYMGAVSQSKVAKYLSEGSVFVVNSFYETCNRMGMEAHAAGLPIVAGPHICFDEWPCAKRFTTLDGCIKKIQEVTTDFSGLPGSKLREDARRWAEAECSYEVSLEQLNTILRRL